jgi:hypothetical protein
MTVFISGALRILPKQTGFNSCLFLPDCRFFKKHGPTAAKKWLACQRLVRVPKSGSVFSQKMAHVPKIGSCAKNWIGVQPKNGWRAKDWRVCQKLDRCSAKKWLTCQRLVRVPKSGSVFGQKMARVPKIGACAKKWIAWCLNLGERRPGGGGSAAQMGKKT